MLEFLNTAFYYLFISILGVLAIGVLISVLWLAFPFVIIVAIIVSLIAGQFFLAFFLGIVWLVWHEKVVKSQPSKWEKFPFK